MYGHVITKFSRMGSLPHFFTHGAPLRALRARELRYKMFLPVGDWFVRFGEFVANLSSFISEILDFFLLNGFDSCF